MKKIFSLFVVVCLCLGLFFIEFQNKNTTSVTQKLTQIPKEDREHLEWFFYYLHRDFSYVLFGKKPMAFCCFLDTKSTVGVQPFDLAWIYFLDPLHIDSLRLKKGLETWEKYKKLFPSSTFVIVSTRHPCTHHYDWIKITIIHKKHFLQKIRDHLDDFKAVLGNQITPKEILQRCQYEDISDILHHHDGLLGTLLGFGRNNSWLFYKLYTENDETIESQLQSFTEGDILDFNPLFMTLPGFRAVPNDPETVQLKESYLKQYKNIIHHYQKGNFLEITLKQLSN